MRRLQEQMRGIFPQRIWQQLFVVLVFLVVIPLVILGVLLIQTSQQAVKTSVFRDNEEIAVRAAREIEEFSKAPKEMLKATASILSVLHADPWRQETVIVEVALRQPIFQRIASVNLDGKEMASSELGTPLRDHAQETVFLKAKEGEDYASEVRMSGNHIPVVTMATPIRRFGAVVGVLTAEVNLRGIWNIVDSIRIGATGRASVILASGQLISHPDKKRVLKNEFLGSQEAGHNVRAGKPGSWEEPGDQGSRWLVSYAPIPGLGWGLMIVQSTKEAYAFSKIMKTQSWILILLSIFATVLISIVMARFISRPINMMVTGTRRIAQGDFDYRLTTKRKDEIGELLEAFNVMTAKLKDVQRMEKLSVIGKAATTIAHELKNSLSLVNTYIQILPKRYREKEFINDFSTVVPRELDSWKAMLKNMTDYSQSSQFPFEPVDIDGLLKEVAVMAQERAAQQNISFALRNGMPLPPVRGNGEKLRQVLWNLLLNAFEATPVGGAVVVSADFIDATQRDTIPHVKIQVEDTGVGIPPRYLKRIFEPFFTTRINGLGLGLSISKDIVENHGGRLEVVSVERKGAIFTVRLPVREP